MARSRNLTPAPEWVQPGNGAYICREHRLQFHTVAASHTHAREFHPETIRTITATPERMAAGRAAMADLRAALGR